jgi:hypothetical protein
MVLCLLLEAAVDREALGLDQPGQRLPSRPTPLERRGPSPRRGNAYTLT